MNRVLERSGPPLPDDVDLAASVTELFASAAKQCPEAPFLVSLSLPDESYDFARFDEEARRVASWLVDAAIRPGDRVSILSENRPRWCLAYVAVLHAGAVVVPIDAQLRPTAIHAVLADAGSKALFVSAELSRHVPALRELGYRGLVLGLDETGGDRPFSQLRAGVEAAALPELAGERGSAAPAALLYTSGTTGTPKGVVLTHANLRSLTSSVAIALEFRPEDRLIMFLPLQHVLSQVGSFILPAALRIPSVHAEIHTGEELLGAVREGGVTILLAVPLLFHLIHERIERNVEKAGAPTRWLYRTLLGLNGFLRRALGVNLGRRFFGRVHAQFGPQLRLLASGGSALDLRVQADFLALGFDVIQAYGMTETTGGVAMQPVGNLALGVVGHPLPGATIRIDEPDEEGVGEICVRGPMISPGYNDRPEETAASWREGWLHTGDLGRFKEGDGQLAITGRIKELIILSNGKNIQPEEIEIHFQTSKWIDEICVMGSAHGEQGEKLHAVVVPDWERVKAEGITSVRELVRFEMENLSAELPSYQRILSFDLRREPLPRTATRKLQRFLVEAGSSSAEASEALPPDDQDQAARLASESGRVVERLIRSRLKSGHRLQARSSFELDLGLDSLNRMELLLSIEQALGVGFEDEEAARLQSVDDLLLLVEEKLREGTAAVSARPGGWTELIAGAGPEDLPPSLRRPRGIVSALALRSSVSLATLFLRVAFRLRQEGREHLPARGPFLLCPTHVSYLDAFLVACFLPKGVVGNAFVLGEADYVSGGLAGFLSRFAGIVPTNPNLHLRLAMRAGAAGLKQGRALMIFPEGTRSADGTLQELKLGAAILASELDLPIVPAVIEGAHAAWPRSASRPRWFTPCLVRFGAPLLPSEAPAGLEGDAAHRELNGRLRQALLDLGAPPPPPPS